MQEMCDERISLGLAVGCSVVRAGVVLLSFRRAFTQPGCLPSFCAIRAFTNFFTSAAGSGLLTGKRIVPLDVWNSLSSFLNAFIKEPLMGNKLQWFENAANPTRGPL